MAELDRSSRSTGSLKASPDKLGQQMNFPKFELIPDASRRPPPTPHDFDA